MITSIAACEISLRKENLFRNTHLVFASVTLVWAITYIIKHVIGQEGVISSLQKQIIGLEI